MKKTPPDSKDLNKVHPSIWIALAITFLIAALAITPKVLHREEVPGTNVPAGATAEQAALQSDEVVAQNAGASNTPAQSTDDESFIDPKQAEREAMYASLGFGSESGHKVAVGFSKRKGSERVPFAKVTATNDPAVTVK